MRFISFKSLSLCLLISNWNILFADDLKVGRLSDGTPYRIDQDGTKISDYLAELELTVLDLERTLQAVNDENVALRAEIERLKSGRQDFIVENDLLKKTEPAKELGCTEDGKHHQDKFCQNCSALNSELSLAKNRIEELEISTSNFENQLQASVFENQQASINIENACRLKIAEMKDEIDLLKAAQAESSLSQCQLIAENQASYLEETRAGLTREFQLLLNEKDSRDLLLTQNNLISDNIEHENSTITKLENEIPAASNLEQIHQLSKEVVTLREKFKLDLERLESE